MSAKQKARHVTAGPNAFPVAAKQRFCVVLENSRSADRQQAFAYTASEWEVVRALLQRIGWDAETETLPSNTIDVKTRTRIPASLRLILESAASSQQKIIRFSSNLKEDRTTARKALRSMYARIDRARGDCEEIISVGTPGVDMTNMEITMHSLSEAASCCAQELEALRYRPEGNQNAGKGVHDYLSRLAEIWDLIESDPQSKRVWRRRFMTLAAEPFLGPDTYILIESWERQQRRMRSAIP